MARQVLPIVGAVAGFVISGGNPYGAQIGFAVGSMIGNAVDPIEMQGRKLGDSPTQVAAEGGARAIVYGKGCIRATCILERGGRRVIKQRDSSGGKGGGPTTINERALWTFAIGLGEPVAAILRIWENEKLVYDVTPESVIQEDTAAFSEKFRFYTGAEDQLPDPALEALHGDDTPYYRGTAYIVFPQYDLTDFGETVPTYRVEVASAVQDIEPQIIPQDRTTIAFITGGGASNIADQYLADFVPSFEEIDFSEVVGHWFRFSLRSYAIDPEAAADIRVIVYNGAGQGGGIVWDSGWHGNPANQSALSIALAAAGLEQWDGVITEAIPVLYKSYYPTYLVSGDIELNEASMAGYSVRILAYRPDTSVSVSLQLDRASLDDLPEGAVVMDGYPSVYSVPVGPVAVVDWVSPELPPPELPQSGAGLPIAVGNIVASLHQRAGHSSEDYDVSELTVLSRGVVVESTVTGAEAINSILGGRFADPSDYDGSINYILRGKPVVTTLTPDDWIDEPEEAQRNNAIEYPRKVHFLGQRADLAYASSKSTSARYSSDAKVVGEIAVGSPETFDDGLEPSEIAVKLHKVLWTEAEGEREWNIPDNHIDLVPTDCVALSYRDQLIRCRILEIEDTPGQRKLKMIRDRQSAYTANLTEIPNPPAPTPPQSSIVAPTIMAFIDTSALTDNADTLHYLVALSGANDNWAGAVLQQQLSGQFQSIDSTTLNSIMGVVQNTVSDASPYYTDTTNSVVVRLYTDDELESRTEAEFLSNGGAFFLSYESSGETVWEIMQFRDAVQDPNGDWVLSHLMRGRKNTPTNEHPPGSIFVWIDPSILRESAQSSWLNTELTHRAVSNGQSPELATPQTNEYVGNSQREWPVADLLLSRPDADTVDAEAIPRHRFGTSMNPIRSINWDGYQWTVTDGSNTTNRTGTSATETFDTTGWASPVTVTVAQLNRITGAGPEVSEDIA